VNITIDQGIEAFRCATMPEGFFELLPQEAVRFSRFPVTTKHNAIWDFGFGHGGAMYAALCGELGNAVDVQLYQYDRRTGALELCFDGGRETMADPRMIPPSKIHTSIAAIRDGKVIMTTHTTSRSEEHPYWLFEQHYTHQWEGFPGSHVLVWDPALRTCVDLGVPVARDSIYGAAYDGKYHALWFTTFLRGHLYRLDLETRKVRAFGQITEFGSYAVIKDPLGNLLTASRSGHVFHIDVDDCRITDLGVFASEPEPNPLWQAHQLFAHHAAMPDGRLLLSFHFSDRLYAFDPATLRSERLGDFRPPSFIAAAPWMSQKGLAFDSKGILWEATMCPINVAAGSVAHLHRWDIMGGGEPEYAGLLGIPDRVTSCLSEMHMDADDVLHIADTNHGEDMPGILAVNTRALQRRNGDGPFLRGERVRDVTAYLLYADGGEAYPADDYDRAAAPYATLLREMDEYGEFLDHQGCSRVRAEETRAIRLWDHFGRGEGSRVLALEWISPDQLVFALPSGSHLAGAESEFQTYEKTDQALAPRAVMPPVLKDARPPSRQGRQFKSGISAWGPWGPGSWIIGTEDGCVALFHAETGKTFALGAVGVHGPVHQIAVANGHAFGVSGDPNDLGHVFHYDDATGLRELGRLFFKPAKGPVFSSTQPIGIAVSPDASRVAVSVADALGCIYVYQNVFLDTL
jgi:hypothetical protein